LKDELSNKEAQTKLVEKMLGDVKKLTIMASTSSNSLCKSNLRLANSKVAEVVRYENYSFNYKWKFRIEYFYSKPTTKVEVKEQALLEVLQISMA
jgi:hypothetical protein